MSQRFILSCESTVDLPYNYIAGRNIPVLFYSYTVDDTAYVDDMQKDPQSLERFYALLDAGKLPSTSQLNMAVYEEFFDVLLQQGDVLHIAFGSGMTQSVRNARLAAETMREKYPDRRLVVVDSLCSCSGYGMLVDSAADRRDAGCSLDEVESWVLQNRQKIHHQFFATNMKYFHRSGRVSGPVAMMGTLLNICPIMRLNDEGRIIAYRKARGKRRALQTTVEVMQQHAQNGADYDDKCYIAHSHAPEDAAALKEAVEAAFPKLKGRVQVFEIGTIIVSHCGPGTVAVFFMGDDRAPSDKG